MLAGAAVSSLTAAGIALALNFAPNPYAAYEIMNWLLGSLADKSWTPGLADPAFCRRRLRVAGHHRPRAGCAVAGRGAGAKPGHQSRRAFAWWSIAGTALAVGAATSVTGAIGFIGLVAPHLARPFVGHQPSRMLLPATLGGALLLLVADIAARLIHLGPELKLGVFTSLVGTPFFFWLVVRSSKGPRHEPCSMAEEHQCARGGRDHPAAMFRCRRGRRVRRRDRAQWRGQIHLAVGAGRVDRAGCRRK